MEDYISGSKTKRKRKNPVSCTGLTGHKTCVEQVILLKKHRIPLVLNEVLCFLTLYLTTIAYDANFSICRRFNSIEEWT